MDGSDLMAGLLGEDEDEAQLLYDSEEDIAAPSEQVPVAAANLDYHPSGKCDCADSKSPAFILPCGACGTPRPRTHTCPGCAVHMCTPFVCKGPVPGRVVAEGSMKVWCPRCDPKRQQQQPNQSHKRQRDNEGASRAAKAQSVDLTGDDMMNDEEEEEFDDGDDMDEDHQEDGEQDEEEGQGSETYAAQSNKATKKVKNFTEVMQRPDSAFCASKARRKQQLGAAQTRGRNPKKIQGSRVADVKKGTLMKRPEQYPGEGLKVVAGCLVSCSCFIFNFHLNIPQTTPSCARGVSASSWPSRWLVARSWSVAWSMHTRRLSYLYLVLAISNNHPDCSLCQRQIII